MLSAGCVCVRAIYGVAQEGGDKHEMVWRDSGHGWRTHFRFSAHRMTMTKTRRAYFKSTRGPLRLPCSDMGHKWRVSGVRCGPGGGSTEM